MKKFPKYLTPDFLSKFSSFNDKRQSYYLRKFIYEWMLTPAFETRCFDLQILPKYSQEILDDFNINVNSDVDSEQILDLIEFFKNEMLLSGDDPNQTELNFGEGTL
jgi:hypothetical protein